MCFFFFFFLPLLQAVHLTHSNLLIHIFPVLPYGQFIFVSCSLYISFLRFILVKFHMWGSWCSRWGNTWAWNKIIWSNESCMLWLLVLVTWEASLCLSNYKILDADIRFWIMSQMLVVIVEISTFYCYQMSTFGFDNFMIILVLFLSA